MFGMDDRHDLLLKIIIFKDGITEGLEVGHGIVLMRLILGLGVGYLEAGGYWESS